MNLKQLQRTMLGLIQQPLTPSERTRSHTRDGRSIRKIAGQIIKPNDRLTSVERLEIYNRVYWFRILSALAEDFPGLRAVVGQRRFDKLLVAYLTDCPSESFTLRNLGSRLEPWLRRHPGFAPGVHRLALDMVRLEWADIEAYDSAESLALAPADLAHLGDNPSLHLQPYLYLLDFVYPVDEFLLRIREIEEQQNEAQEKDFASNVFVEGAPRHPGRRLSLPKREKVFLAVHRQELTVYFKRLQPEAFTLLRTLQQGKPLAGAIAASIAASRKRPEQITAQLHDWFANWASLGWFCKPSPR
jgi:hypothetical protein